MAYWDEEVQTRLRIAHNLPEEAWDIKELRKWGPLDNLNGPPSEHWLEWIEPGEWKGGRRFHEQKERDLLA